MFIILIAGMVLWIYKSVKNVSNCVFLKYVVLLYLIMMQKKSESEKGKKEIWKKEKEGGQNERRKTKREVGWKRQWGRGGEERERDPNASQELSQQYLKSFNHFCALSGNGLCLPLSHVSQFSNSYLFSIPFTTHSIFQFTLSQT